jgi:hypothetical protein
MGVVTHPKVYIFVPVYIPDFGTLCFFYEERVGEEVVNVMGDPSRHDLFSPFEEAFGKRCLLSIRIKEMFHLRNSTGLILYFKLNENGIATIERPFE